MRGYSVEKTIAPDRTLQLEALPFAPGELVDVIILTRKPEPSQVRTLKDSVLKYEQSFEPVAADDWDALQ